MLTLLQPRLSSHVCNHTAHDGSGVQPSSEGRMLITWQHFVRLIFSIFSTTRWSRSCQRSLRTCLDVRPLFRAALITVGMRVLAPQDPSCLGVSKSWDLLLRWKLRGLDICPIDFLTLLERVISPAVPRHSQDSRIMPRERHGDTASASAKESITRDVIRLVR